MEKRLEAPDTHEVYIHRDSSLAAYDSNQLYVWFKSHGLYEAWCKWSAGSTGVILYGCFCTYIWDVEDFLAGRPNLD